MADDHNQRPYRGNETLPRSAAAAGNDPLAELARLIGQNDPFSEFGNNARRAPVARQPDLAPAWPPESAMPPQQAPQSSPLGAAQYGSQEFTRQPFGGAPLPVGDVMYNGDGRHQAYPPANAQAGGYAPPNFEVPGYTPGYDASGFPVMPGATGYEQEPFLNSQPQFAPQPLGTDEDYYDDVPPGRRRVGVLAIAGVFALAVIGTAGAFGYRAVFGSPSVSSVPPVIKAEQTPSKIVPAAVSKDAQNNKLITDRANERGPGERLVSREEQPVTVTTIPAAPTQAASFAAAPAQPLGNGLVGSEPKRIRTIAIKPDQLGDVAPAPIDAAPQPVPQPLPQAAPQPAPQPRVVAVAPRAAATTPVPLQAPQQVQSPAVAPARQSSPPPLAQREAAEPEQARAQANAPLSLNPNAPSAPAPVRAAPPQRTAAVAAPAAAASSGGGYGVQVSAQRSEEEAQAAFRSLQAKFPSQLGGRQPFVKRVDLGDKGIYFRAMVGPFGSQGEAGELCGSLKSAGGTCLVQKN